MRILLIIGLIMYAAGLFAQTDTVYLKEVKVSGQSGKYTKGMSVTEVDSTLQLHYEGSSLGAMLQNSTGIYIRQYGGEGQLASVSFRGTTPNHTQVSWKGLDINSQTLGQSDFSSIPVFLFQDCRIYHGASSIMFGSGAVGGTIELGNKVFNQGFSLSSSQKAGSYGKRFLGVRSSYRADRWTFFLSGVGNAVENDFEVRYRSRTYNQNNAASRVKAVLGGAKYYLSSTSAISLDLWYNYHDREIQPIIGNFTSEDHLLDKNLRMHFGFQEAFRKSYLSVSLAYMDDRQTYNAVSHTNLKRWVYQGTFDWSPLDYLDFELKGDFTAAFPEVSNYTADTSQYRGGLGLLSSWRIFPGLNASFNLRLPYMQGVSAPVMPSLGTEYKVVRSKSTTFSLLTQVARSYRFPTLNDLFWQPGGNPNLKPEDGWSCESGLKNTFQGHSFLFSSHLSVYRSVISDMIIWTPNGSFWFPKNIRKVQIRGAEISFDARGVFHQVRWRTQVSYSFNHSENQYPLNQVDRSAGKQLAYVPFHKGTVMSSFYIKKWSFQCFWSFTGKRFTEATNTTAIDAFSVVDLTLGRKFDMQNHQLEVGAEVRNLWDTDYQNYELRAIPGRNYLISLNYYFNKSKS